MKCRNGFVSNSSSSSFIVAFPKIPKNVEETQEMMFPNGDENYGFEYSLEEISKAVFDDISFEVEHHRKVSKKKVLADLDLSYKYSNEELMKEYKEANNNLLSATSMESLREARTILSEIRCKWDKLAEEWAKEAKKEYRKIHDKMFYFKLEYSDEGSGFGSTLEHGDIFRNLPYVQRISHH